MSELFDAVDALVASRSPLPSAAERKRLRAAHGLTLDEVAGALQVRRATVSGWESTKKPTEPRGPEREAYARAAQAARELYPRTQRCLPRSPALPATRRKRGLCPAGPAPEAAAMTATENTQTPAPAPSPLLRPPRRVRRAPPGRRRRRAARAREGGPGRNPGGRSRPAVRERAARGRRRRATGRCWRTASAAWSWTCPPSPSRPWWTGRSRRRSSVQPKLSGPGKDADPLLVLTEAALRALRPAGRAHGGGAARRAAPGGPQGHQAAGRARSGS